MKREYSTTESSEVTFFYGNEIERTPAFGKPTLFVVGLQSTDEIEKHLIGCAHIFFGANHSYQPQQAEEYSAWDKMIEHFLEKDYLCSLDIPMQCIEEFLDGGLCEYNNFIPQIRVPIPYIKLWNYNTMVKIDDKDFNASNPGVWTHSLHELMDRNKFTDWSQYRNDEVIK